MGTYTLENFRSELLFDLRNRSDTSSAEGFSTARQESFINAAYLHVCHPAVFRHREMEHTYTIPLVNGTQSYVFTPNSSNHIVAIKHVSHVESATDVFTATRTKLFPRDEQWFQSRTHQSGTPRDYMLRSVNILLSPIPGPNEAGQVLSIGSWREPALLTAGTTTVLSTRWDEIVLLAARWRAELHLGYRDLAEATKLDFVSLINEYQDEMRMNGEDWDHAIEVRTESYMERV